MNLELVYKGKRVFVTGHTGFKGSWLINWLHLLGAEVMGYALAPEHQHDLYHAIQGDELCTSMLADIRDKDRLKKELLSFQPDFVFHLAAQPLVRLSYSIPVDTFEVNAQGTAHVLEAMRYLDKPCVGVMITTDKVYHNREEQYHYKEDDKLGGYDPYSASKAAAEIIIQSFRSSFFNPEQYGVHLKSISSARAGNVIGGGDWALDRIVPDIVRSLSQNKPVTVRNPKSVRPWQHVLEPLHGYLVLGAHQSTDPVAYADAFNLGPYNDDALSVGELVEKAITCWGGGYYEVQQQTGSLHEAGLLQLDISKALNKLEWKPKMRAHQAIERTISWYKSFNTGKLTPTQLLRNDICEYQSSSLNTSVNR